jgi:hypothetical protein
MIAVIELIGIRCTVKNFSLEFELRQLMLVDEREIKPLASECLIQKPVFGSTGQASTDNKEKEALAESNSTEYSKHDMMTEVDMEAVTEAVVESSEEPLLKIKTNSEVYRDIYEKALKRALMARDLGVLHYLESKNITDTDILLDTSDLQT